MYLNYDYVHTTHANRCNSLHILEILLLEYAVLGCIMSAIFSTILVTAPLSMWNSHIDWMAVDSCCCTMDKTTKSKEMWLIDIEEDV